jgi:hypothetical protein
MTATVPAAYRAGIAQADALAEAVALWCEWTGADTIDAVTRRRLAIRIGFGRTPIEAVLREFSYQVLLATACPRVFRAPVLIGQ